MLSKKPNVTQSALLLPGILAALLVAPPALGAEADQIDYATLRGDELKEVLKPIPPRSPQEALKTLEIVDGFKVELAASEPMVFDPVAGCIDENGAMYICELADYPYRPEEGDPPLGKVRLLLDRDGDGFYETGHLFADGLLWPAGIAPWKGGVFVTSPPDIWYMKDTDGDGVADVREKVFTGFGDSGAQYIMNNLRWSLDHKIYLSVAGNGGEVVPATRTDSEIKPLSVRGRDFRFDPVTRDYEAISGGKQFANTFDDWGARFLCSQDTFLYQVEYPLRYLERNPLLAVPDTRIRLVRGGVPIFRTSPVETWRAIRSSRRILSGKGKAGNSGVSHNVSDGVAGTTIYRGDALPSSFYNNTFSGDAQNNLVHRRSLERDGVLFRSERADENTEFLRSDDNWFRPVNFLNAPDGSLYVLDLCREILEAVHIPMDVVQHLDLTMGRDYGRVYRVVPEEWERPEAPRLGEASSEEWVEYLEHPGVWWRETAHRLIYERQDKSIAPRLRQLLSSSDSPQARVLALYSLQGLNHLTEDDVLLGLEDSHPGIRERSLLLAESFLPGSQSLAAAILSLVDDPDERVRYQAAYTLGELDDREAAARGLAALATRDLDDPLIRTAILSSSFDRAPEILTLLLKNEDFVSKRGSDDFIFALTRVAAYKKKPEAVADFIENRLTETTLDSFLLGAHAGLKESGVAFDEVRDFFSDQTRRVLATKKAETSEAIDDLSTSGSDLEKAIRFMGLFSFEETTPLLTKILDEIQPEPIQIAVFETLAAFDDGRTPSLLLERWKGASPGARRVILSALFSKEDSIHLILDRVEEERMLPSELDASAKSRLIHHPNETIRSRATALLQAGGAGSRAEIVETFREATGTPGDTEAGKEIFERLCSTCHLLNGLGKELGPNLALSGSRSKDELLVHILDPNREVNPIYLQYHVTTLDGGGEIRSGMLTSETSQSLTLKNQDEEVTIQREDVESLVGSGLSVMPEGLEEGLTVEQMASLLEFLVNSQYDLGTSGASFATDQLETD